MARPPFSCARSLALSLLPCSLSLSLPLPLPLSLTLSLARSGDKLKACVILDDAAGPALTDTTPEHLTGERDVGGDLHSHILLLYKDMNILPAPIGLQGLIMQLICYLSLLLQQHCLISQCDGSKARPSRKLWFTMWEGHVLFHGGVFFCVHILNVMSCM